MRSGHAKGMGFMGVPNPQRVDPEAIMTTEEPFVEEPLVFPKTQIDSRPGMSLRDYFAAKAMAALASECQGKNWAEDCALSAYALADAMLDARKS